MMARAAPIYWYDPYANEPLVAFEAAVQNYSSLPSDVQHNAREMVLGFLACPEAAAISEALTRAGVPTRVGALTLPLYVSTPSRGVSYSPTAFRLRAANGAYVISLSDIAPDWRGRPIWGLPAGVAQE
jgi:2-methylcitrate dehydratase PrpD